MRRLTLFALALSLAAAGCGSSRHAGSSPNEPPAHAVVVRAPVPQAHVEKVPRCTDGELVRLGSKRRAYAGVAARGAVAYRRPGGSVVARFGPKNVNRFPTVFGVVGKVVAADCSTRWYRVQLPVMPNGSIGFVRAGALALQPVGTRIVVDVSSRRLILYRNGKAALTAVVAVGSPSTPTPTGSYYVNQVLVPSDPSGPFGPAALGISAHSDVLTGWTQGGPVAIHGTNEPWSIGHAVSNGCIRLPNATLSRIFAVAGAGTPVIIRA
ncbi:MAG: L,D-transpeptidase [Gaiellaceae bacterium]